MKNIIINILILILIFNIIMIIFPEGKTQKFCRISIKIFIMFYIFDNIFFNGSIELGFIGNMPTTSSSFYEREVSLQNVDQKFIDSLNKDNYQGEEVIKNISLSFTENMNIKAKVYLNKLLNIDEVNDLKQNIAEIFQISSDNIDIISGGIYEQPN